MSPLARYFAELFLTLLQTVGQSFERRHERYTPFRAVFFACLTCATPSALALYEHSITFGKEIKVIWQRKQTLTTVLFLCNRYNVLCSAVMLLLMGMRVTQNSVVRFSIIENGHTDSNGL